jgi:hypothetical protein
MGIRYKSWREREAGREGGRGRGEGKGKEKEKEKEKEEKEKEIPGACRGF